MNAMDPHPVLFPPDAMPDDGLPPELPHSIEAEQALLGAILVNNDALSACDGMVEPDSFFEPLHGRIYEAITTIIARGQAAQPVTLKAYFDGDEAMADVGGPAYLAKLAANGVAPMHAKDYAKAIRDLATRRALIYAADDIRVLAENPPLELTVDDMVGQIESDLYALRPAYNGNASKDAEPAAYGATQVMDRLERMLAGEPSRLRPTGLAPLDNLIGGLEPGVVTILAGRPSMGKSALALCIGMHEAGVQFGGVDGWRWRDRRGAVHVASLEMTRAQCSARMLSALTYRRRRAIDADDNLGFSGVPYDDIRKGNVPQERVQWLYDAQKALADVPLYVDDRRDVPVSYIAQGARRTARKAERNGQELGLIVVDHITEVRDSGRWGNNRPSAVGEIAGNLATLARDMDVPVLVLSQLSRKCEERDNKRPLMSDLRESGEIEQKARCIIFPYRDEYYLAREEPPRDHPKYTEWAADLGAARGIVELNVAKNSEGEVGSTKVRGALPYGVFTDLPTHHGGQA